MADNEKIPVSIHLVNTDLFEETAFDEVTNEIIERVNKDGAAFRKIALNNYNEKFELRLYHSSATYPPKWRGFFETLVGRRSSFTEIENTNHSFVCFVGLNSEIYVVTGGFAGQTVARFMIPDFGLQILVRLFDKDSKVVKNIQDRGLTGNILGQTKFYRGDQRFSDENEFGKIFKQVQAELNKELLTNSFGFNKAELKRDSSVCMAKESFQISKAVSFDSMLRLVERLDVIYKRKAKFSLNKVEHLSSRKTSNKILIEELNNWVIDDLYAKCKKGETPDVDFCHKDFDKYLNADSLEIIIDKGDPIEVPRHSTFGDIIALLKNSGDYEDEDSTLFKQSVLVRKLISYDSEGHILTTGTILSHVQGEFTYKEKTYFLIDKEWYLIRPTFISDLDTECLQLLKFDWNTDILPKPFGAKTKEGAYNQKYINEPNFYVFDTITPAGIESCDLLKDGGNDIFLIHVKKGFNNSIRELSSQINIAAKRIQADLRTGYEYITEVQAKAMRSRVGNIGKQVFPKNGIASLFKSKSPSQIIFCLAFLDTATKKRNLKDEIGKFDSNIAKFSILELKGQLNKMGFGFRIIQLERE